jgi:pyruvyl transferase EpsI
MIIKEKIKALGKKIISKYSSIKAYIKIIVLTIPGIKKWKKNNPDGLFLVFTPEHSNMGDHAIAYAEMIMLKELEIAYYEITGLELSRIKKINKLSILNKSKIVVSGGGFLGTLWPGDEDRVREIIKSCPDSKIVMCPNTIYYSNDENGKKSLAESIEIYNAHSYLHIFAREKTSYETMKKIYNWVGLVPDIVLTIPNISFDVQRKGCLLLLRKDIEKTMSQEETARLIQICKDMFESIEISDMVESYCILPKNRNNELTRKWREFAKSELVVTDRLHAMIFSAITGTPCIVLDSKSPKVRGCYEWIKNLEYIKFADSIDMIPEVYKTIPKKKFVYDNTYAYQLSEPLRKELINLVK